VQNLVINYDTLQLSDGLVQLLYNIDNDSYEIVLSKKDQKINIVSDANELINLSRFVSNFVSTNTKYSASKPILGWNENGAVYDE
jgi:hypothetical protein